MAVPTTNIKFSDVKSEIENNGGSTTNDLLQAFTNATGTFHSTYEGSKTGLLNFRGYAHNAGSTSIQLHTNGGTAWHNSTGPYVTRYHEGLQVNDYIFTDEFGLTGFDGGNLWYASSPGGHYKIDTTGKIIEVYWAL